jgi:hypothetical protein
MIGTGLRAYRSGEDFNSKMEKFAQDAARKRHKVDASLDILDAIQQPVTELLLVKPDRIAANVFAIAEYLNYLDAKGISTGTEEDITNINHNALQYASRKQQRSLNSNTASQRGELYQDKAFHLMVLRKLVGAFSSYSSNLAARTSNDVRNIINYKKDPERATRSFYNVAAATSQSVVYAGVRLTAAYWAGALAMSMLRKSEDLDDRKLAGMYEELERLKGSGTDEEVAVMEEKIRLVEQLRRQSNSIKSRSIGGLKLEQGDAKYSQTPFRDQFITDSIGNLIPGVSLLAGSNQAIAGILFDGINQKKLADFKQQSLAELSADISYFDSIGDTASAAAARERQFDIESYKLKMFELPYGPPGAFVGGEVGIATEATFGLAKKLTSTHTGYEQFTFGDGLLAAHALGFPSISELNRIVREYNKFMEKEFDNAREKQQSDTRAKTKEVRERQLQEAN